MHYIAPSAEVREQFHQGGNHRAYAMLGAHPVEQDGRKLWHFAVWAPNARAVSLVGEFCNWDRNACPMKKQFDGTWEVRLPVETFDAASDPVRYGYAGAQQKLLTYKFAVQQQSGEWQDKTDPYAFCMQQRPDTASVLCDLDGYAWHDDAWLSERKVWDMHTSPINIYEVHIGSWKRKGSKKSGDGGQGDTGRPMTYTEFADEIIPYVKDMGYTHIELLPVMEHPLDMSWGYQVSGYFAATSRYGTPQELMALIDRCHQAGVGVILDWVPAHFPKDAFGLRRFDGTACYEHPDPRRGDMPQWGTHFFDLARGEVQSFLMSSACFWLQYYHADGIRVDAVSSMLFYDFCRDGMEWLPNRFGGRENLDGIAFLQKLNTTVNKHFPGVMMIAEESHAFPGVTKPAYLGGLGFDFKWNMGWMNDMLAYVEKDPIYRKWHHDKLTFSLFYAFSENYILPFSHDEVVHGKKSMLDKQPGDLWKKFAGLRALYGYTMSHPGKKLLFMGGEFGQMIEWRYDDQLDWFLLLYDKHPELQKCVRELNRLYREIPALYEVENSWEGFQWVQANDKNNSLTAFIRTDKKGKSILCVTNFTPQYIDVYKMGLPTDGVITEIFNSDRACWGGSDKYNDRPIRAVEEKWNEFDYTVEMHIPPLSTMFFRYDKLETPKKKAEKQKAAAAATPDTAEPESLPPVSGTVG